MNWTLAYIKNSVSFDEWVFNARVRTTRRDDRLGLYFVTSETGRWKEIESLYTLEKSILTEFGENNLVYDEGPLLIDKVWSASSVTAS